MKNLSIKLKLFIISAVFFVLFILIALFGQSLFFEKFYTTQKIDKLKEEITAFINFYDKSDFDDNEIIKQTKIFEQYNNVQLGIINTDFELINKEVFEIIIQERSGNIIRIGLNSIIKAEDYSFPNLHLGDYIYAEGYKWEADLDSFTPNKIDINDILWIKRTENLNTDDIDIVEGRVIAFNLPQQEDLLRGIDNQNLIRVINSWINKNYGRFTYIEQAYVYRDSITLEKNIVIVKPMLNKDSIIFVVASEQPMIESLQVLKSYYVYVILIGVLISMLMSYIFSNFLTKPLIRMNRKAMNMAKLKFDDDDYIEVMTNDEIGSLAMSINTLSYTLKKSLNELQSANDKLVEDIEDKKHMEKVRKEFISGVSHELKTPLGIIKGFAEGIKDGVAGDKTEDYIDIILDEVDKMNSLVLDMLDLSKLQLETYKLEMERFNIVELANDVKDKFANQLKQKKLSMIVQCFENEVYVFGDYRRIEQVLVNYCSNAIRHSYMGEIIEVIISNKNGRILVEVTNVGENISEKNIEKIWDRFYRVEESRTKDDGGTGLGLAITKNILELHNSDFGVRNTENGVVFYFDLLTMEK